MPVDLKNWALHCFRTIAPILFAVCYAYLDDLLRDIDRWIEDYVSLDRAGADAMLVACRLVGLSARLAHTMRASNGAQCGTNAWVQRPRSVARQPRSRGLSKRLLRSRRRVGRIAGRGVPPAPLRWFKKEGNGRLRRVGTEGVFALRARPHATGAMHDTPFEHFAVAHGDMREVRDPRLLFHAKKLTIRAIVQRWARWTG